MLYRVKSAELAQMSPAAKRRTMQELVSHSRSVNGSASAYLEERINQFEMRYEMTSAELQNRLRTQPEMETADIAQWLFFIDLLAKHEREARTEQA